MDLKINSFIVFISLCVSTAFAQEPVQAPKTIIKVSGSDLKASSIAKEPEFQPREVMSIHSCEIKKKEAVITKKNPDGTLTRENIILIEK